MVQILQGPRNLGEIAGTGIGEALNLLAQNKLRQVGQRNVAKGLSSIPGISSDQAQNLSHLEGPVLAQILGDIQRSQREKEFVQGFQQGEQVAQPGINSQQSLIQEAISAGHPAPRNSKEASELAKIAHQARIQKQQFESQQQKESDKETLPYYKDISHKARASTNNSKKLNKIESLAVSGNLGSPVANSLINTISKGVWGHGIDINFLKTADAQELEKLSNDFVKDAKEIFGSRLTDADLAAFFKTLPNLSQSREGMVRVIRNLRIANAADELRKEAADRIIEQNNGRRPRNLETLVENEISPHLDELADQFKTPKLNKPKIAGSESIGSLAQILGVNY